MTKLASIFHSKTIRNRILFTILVLIIIRIGCQLPLPGTDSSVIDQLAGSLSSLGFFNSLTGSSFEKFSVFALNVTVYITASIIVQLLTIAIPKLEEMQKEGEDGRKKLSKITRYLTLGLAVLESVAMVIGFGNQGLFGDTSAEGYWMIAVCNIFILTGGAMVVMWLGDMISEHGVGNGISVILLINIVSSMPSDYKTLFEQFVSGASSTGMAVLAGFVIVALTIGIVAFIVYLNGGERRINVQYSQKMAGRRSIGGSSSHIPLKVNPSGVIPIIFAVSLFQFPTIIANLATGGYPEWAKYFMTSYWCNPQYPQYTAGLILYLILIIFFAYFYTQITFNPAQVSDNLKKQGGFVPGIRPGTATEEYFKRMLKYLVFIGAIGLCIITVIPILVSGLFSASLSFAGTSIIIVVSVILDTSQQINGMLVSRHYEGILSKRR